MSTNGSPRFAASSRSQPTISAMFASHQSQPRSSIVRARALHEQFGVAVMPTRFSSSLSSVPGPCVGAGGAAGCGLCPGFEPPLHFAKTVAFSGATTVLPHTRQLCTVWLGVTVFSNWHFTKRPHPLSSVLTHGEKARGNTVLNRNRYSGSRKHRHSKPSATILASSKSCCSSQTLRQYTLLAAMSLLYFPIYGKQTR